MNIKLFSDIPASRKKKILAAGIISAFVFMTVLSVNAIAALVNPENYIGKEKAESIALEHSGVSEQDAVFLRTHLDRDDGRIVYDVEFYSGNIEYDYEIDAVSGKILEFDRDIESYRIKGKTETSKNTVKETSVSTASYIGEDKAKSIALEHSGVSEQDAVFLRTHLDRDDGRIVYDVEFYSGNIEYDYEIDAVSGKILEFDRDIESYRIKGKTETSKNTVKETSVSTATYISKEEVKSIALSDAGLTESQIRKYKAELDREDGIMVYEVEFKSGKTEYEYEIDAVSGEILKSDKEWDD